MSLVATYHLDAPAYDSLFERVSDLRLEIEQVVACDPDTLLVTFWAETNHVGAFETELERSDTTGAVRHLRSEDGRERYQLHVPASTTTYWEWTAVGGVLLASTVTRHGATTRMEFPDQEALRTYRERCSERGMGFSLNSLTDAGTEPGVRSQPLTRSQREIVALAVGRGYFEVPRRTSMVELAAECGVSDQAASERLRRGLSNLLESGVFDTLWAPASADAPQIG
ncbi:helix-turn-helix domain-containing protein [Halococcus hamelinensis]|uniref:Bacterio-opsin activator HTH domain-containing protein n=1 Tax=Halococcus hamelinensis 100A6 TaxID=1132509 RepID=M0LX95_9EURY|nr:helix-turn-helix domain-containing protein [Halococcus hamelinensis]EMA38061.1 hypothetical protein C447_11510 [Halococcus hamelinensis 100A6]